jgi:hypothetical protein
MDLGHWQIKDKTNIFPENPFGFIYIIQNTINGRQYIGKKQCVSKTKRNPLKGKKRKRIQIKESDWKTYTGSSKELNEDIIKYGKENFTFFILEWCGSKWELGYKEIKKQIEFDVILNEQFYNGILNVRIGRPPKAFKNDKNIS